MLENPHEECILKEWFDNDRIDPPADDMSSDDVPARSGPIKASFQDDYVEWE